VPVQVFLWRWEAPRKVQIGVLTGISAVFLVATLQKVGVLPTGSAIATYLEESPRLSLVLMFLLLLAVLWLVWGITLRSVRGFVFVSVVYGIIFLSHYLAFFLHERGMSLSKAFMVVDIVSVLVVGILIGYFILERKGYFKASRSTGL